MIVNGRAMMQWNSIFDQRICFMEIGSACKTAIFLPSRETDGCGDRFWRRTLRAGLGSDIGNSALNSATVEDGQYADDWEEDISQGRIEDVHRIGEEVSELPADEGVVDASLFVFTLVARDGFAFAIAGDHLGEGDGKDPVKESE